LNPGGPHREKVKQMDSRSPTAEVQNEKERKEVTQDFDPSVVIFACRH
jgi:hypothetical protein